MTYRYYPISYISSSNYHIFYVILLVIRLSSISFTYRTSSSYVRIPTDLARTYHVSYLPSYVQLRTRVTVRLIVFASSRIFVVQLLLRRTTLAIISGLGLLPRFPVKLLVPRARTSNSPHVITSDIPRMIAPWPPEGSYAHPYVQTPTIAIRP